MGHPADNIELAPHFSYSGHLIDFVIRFHRKIVEASERVDIPTMLHLKTLAAAGDRHGLRNALHVVGPLMDEGGVTSLIAGLNYLPVPPG